MGHYGASNLLESMRASNAKESVFEAFKEHCSGKRVNSELQTLETIRVIESDKHITPVSPHSCDLLGFAKAGHAVAELITSGDRHQWIRNYRAPPSRMDLGDGKLSDSVQFGLYNYKWVQETFQVYKIGWQDEYNGFVTYYYILSDKAALDEQGHSEPADRLITACGKWSSQLHEEIYVFDSGCWMKNTELWSAVQSASFDDVILDPTMKETLINDVETFFDSRAIYEEYSVPWKRGIIFHGTPGCGKTITIKS